MSSKYATCLVHLTLLDLIILITFGGVYIIKFLILQFSPSSHYFLPLRSKYSPQHPFSNFSGDSLYDHSTELVCIIISLNVEHLTSELCQNTILFTDYGYILYFVRKSKDTHAIKKLHKLVFWVVARCSPCCIPTFQRNILTPSTGVKWGEFGSALFMCGPEGGSGQVNWPLSCHRMKKRDELSSSQPWRWRQYVTLTCWYTTTSLCSVTTQMTTTTTYAHIKLLQGSH
jgi:hypothetical protein